MIVSWIDHEGTVIPFDSLIDKMPIIFKEILGSNVDLPILVHKQREIMNLREVQINTFGARKPTLTHVVIWDAG